MFKLFKSFLIFFEVIVIFVKPKSFWSKKEGSRNIQGLPPTSEQSPLFLYCIQDYTKQKVPENWKRSQKIIFHCNTINKKQKKMNSMFPQFFDNFPPQRYARYK